jgi:multidrug efflux pump subunit AcrA (membrane-fusion protein)
MIRFSSSLKFSALSAALVLGACTHKQEAVTTPPPPPVAAPAPAPAPVASGILPGSAEDLRVNVGDTVKKGAVLADTSTSDNGQIALGHNALVAFMSWSGSNYEDAIIVSEKLVKK